MSSDTQTERAAEDAERRKQVALFRHSVIGDLVHLEPGHHGMYSLLHDQRGLMKKRSGEPTTKDRRHFEFEKAGEMWMSDVMYGPKFRVGERLRALVKHLSLLKRGRPVAA